MNILIAEDNKHIATILCSHITRAGYHPISVYDGQSALDVIFSNQSIDLVLLDIMMPKVDGFEVCKRIREHSMVPIIIISAKKEEYDKIMGLELGADDYIEKPFSPQEIIARIKAVSRRYQGRETLIIRGSLKINDSTRTVSLDNKTLSLTKKEYDILFYLASHPNQTFSRDHLLDHLWGWDYQGDFRTIDSHINRLRDKLDQFDHLTWAIATVWGVGYRFEVLEYE